MSFRPFSLLLVTLNIMLSTPRTYSLHGDLLADFLNEQRTEMLPFFRSFTDVFVSPFTVGRSDTSNLTSRARMSRS